MVKSYFDQGSQLLNGCEAQSRAVQGRVSGVLSDARMAGVRRTVARKARLRRRRARRVVERRGERTVFVRRRFAVGSDEFGECAARRAFGRRGADRIDARGARGGACAWRKVHRARRFHRRRVAGFGKGGERRVAANVASAAVGVGIGCATRTGATRVATGT